MKLLVEFELDDSWEAYLKDDDERLECLIRPMLGGVKTRIVKNLDLQNVSSLVCINGDCGGNIDNKCKFGRKYKKCVSRQT